jgi:hypothetical protein
MDVDRDSANNIYCIKRELLLLPINNLSSEEAVFSKARRSREFKDRRAECAQIYI